MPTAKTEKGKGGGKGRGGVVSREKRRLYHFIQVEECVRCTPFKVVPVSRCSKCIYFRERVFKKIICGGARKLGKRIRNGVRCPVLKKYVFVDSTCRQCERYGGILYGALLCRKQ